MKGSTDKVARRYAKALVSLSDERGDGEAVRTALAQLIAVFQQAPEGLHWLANPTVPAQERKAALATMLDGLGVQGTARSLVQLLLDKGRIDAVPAITREFGGLLDARTGRVQAEVTSATPLSDAAVGRLKALLQKMLNKDVVLQTGVDAGLLGGMVVRVGNTVFDSSVRNHLTRLRHSLVSD